MSVAVVEAEAWRFYRVSVAAVRRLGPSFVRLTFTGPDLDEFADNGWDQRFKLVLPAAEGGYSGLVPGSGWYAAWRALPEPRRPSIRTYTVRGVRPDLREVDVDMVLHGDGGPASRFAGSARVGDEVVLLGPNTRFTGVHGGLEYRPPVGHTGPVLLAGDATAVPALLEILARLPEHTRGEAVLEVPTARDVQPAERPAGMRLTWLVCDHGSKSGLPAAVDAAVERLAVPRDAAAPEQELEPDPGDDPVWDVPDTVPPSAAAGLYAWLAGESSVITGLRRRLVRDLGVDKRSVAFMGYWREGRPGG
jgi:NADPH-dependent ferric siderophore reductase